MSRSPSVWYSCMSFSRLFPVCNLCWSCLYNFYNMIIAVEISEHTYSYICMQASMQHTQTGRGLLSWIYVLTLEECMQCMLGCVACMAWSLKNKRPCVFLFAKADLQIGVNTNSFDEPRGMAWCPLLPGDTGPGAQICIEAMNVFDFLTFKTGPPRSWRPRSPSNYTFDEDIAATNGHWRVTPPIPLASSD